MVYQVKFCLRFWIQLFLQIFFVFTFTVGSGCHFEKPDPASQAMAILEKHPSDFLDQLRALDALTCQEGHLPSLPWLDIIYLQSHALQMQMNKLSTDSEKVLLFTHFIFDSLNIQPVLETNEIANSLPSQVLNHHAGSCVGISLVALALSHQINFPLFPVFLPGHLFLRYQSETYRQNIETLKGGIARTDSFYQVTFMLPKRPWYHLKNGNSNQALVALLFNMANLHLQNSEYQTALTEYKLVEKYLPQFPEAEGNMGVIYLKNHEPEKARKLFLSSFAGDSISAAIKLYLKPPDPEPPTTEPSVPN